MSLDVEFLTTERSVMKKDEREYPSGEVEGPDGPMRRTRANTLAGFNEPSLRRGGRNQAYIDEEGAWLNAHFLEE